MLADAVQGIAEDEFLPEVGVEERLDAQVIAGAEEMPGWFAAAKWC